MSKFRFEPRKRCSISVVAAMAFVLLAASPSAAQRDPLDLARAGFSAKQHGEFSLAIRLFDEALKQSVFDQKQRGMLFYGRGVSYEALGAHDRGLADFDAAVALIPEFPNTYLYRGIIWGNKGEHQRALQDFLTAGRLNPTDPLVFNNLGNVYQELGDLDRAFANFGRAIELQADNAQTYFNRARAYILKQDSDSAMADYDKAITLQPMFEEAYVNRAGLKLMRRDLKGAISDLDTAIRLNPRDPSAWSNRGMANLAFEKYSDGVHDFDQALRINPGSTTLYLRRGWAQLFAGAVDDSIADFKTTIRLRSSNPYPAIWLHIARIHRGDDDQAELAENAKDVTRGAWPSVMLDFYLGALDAEGVRAAAQQGNSAGQAKRDCEANYFLGEFALHNNQPERARYLLHEVTTSCGPDEVVFSAALAESKLLSKQWSPAN
jgi:lipoprotein NlpI